MYGSQASVYHFACIWPTAMKLGCIINFDMLFLVMGFISLLDEIQYMLISSRHVYIRSIHPPRNVSDHYYLRTN